MRGDAPTMGRSLQSGKKPAQPSVQACRLIACDVLEPAICTKKRLPPGEKKERKRNSDRLKETKSRSS